MGLLSKLFGGGTKLALRLDATQAPAGGMLSGTLTLSGGKKDLTLTSLQVRLVYILVRSSEGSSLPEIKTEVLNEQTLAEGQSLAGGSSHDFEFSFELPSDLDPSGDGVTYKVMAVADIPKVADPKADATFTVVEGAGMDLDTLTLEDVYARWPGLRSDDDDVLCDELREVMLACYEERDGLQVVEPLLAKLIRSSGSMEVKTQAIDTWGNLLDGHVRKEHIAFLGELVHSFNSGTDSSFRCEVITAVAKFADEGALSLIKELAKSADAEIREEVASQLRFAASDTFRGKLAVLESMADDDSAKVRASVFGAFSDFRDKKKIMRRVAERIDTDPSDEVQAACIGTLTFLHDEGLGELMQSTYTKHLKNPHPLVRKEIAQNLQTFPESEAGIVAQLAKHLLADQDAEVRRATAWNFVNLSDFPTLAPLVRAAAENDPDAKVRGDALYGMQSIVPVAELLPYYSQRLAADPTEEAAWGVIGGLRDHSETSEAQAILRQLCSSPFSRVVEAAREELGEG